jgi:acetylornithine deacetylase/succinyl-diaminopimelate desuccinylase-like protein
VSSLQSDAEVIDLLQQLIRNECVNDGTKASGNESKSVDLLDTFLDGSGCDVQRYEPELGRGSLVAKIEGSDPSAPSLLLMGHTDVVPVNPDGWRRDPFGGELVDGFVWGRGALDMLNETASMAAAFKRLAKEGWRPRGTLTYLAVADEEALGTYGAGWLTKHHADAVKADFVVTESGGFEMPLPSASGPKMPVMVAEKGAIWTNLRVRGTPGHGSMPFRTDNALVKAAEVVRRISQSSTETRITEFWRRFVESADLPPDMAAMLLDPKAIDEFVGASPDLGIARMVQACTHMSIAPTVVHGGTKTNVIPDVVDLQLDIRTLPGQGASEVRAQLEEMLGDLASQVDFMGISDDDASASPLDTPLWDSLRRATQALVPGSTTVPFIQVGATDARFFRRMGTVAYGAGIFSPKISFGEFQSMFHGNDERIDVDSIHMGTEFWRLLAKDMLE